MNKIVQHVVLSMHRYRMTHSKPLCLISLNDNKMIVVFSCIDFNEIISTPLELISMDECLCVWSIEWFKVQMDIGFLTGNSCTCCGWQDVREIDSPLRYPIHFSKIQHSKSLFMWIAHQKQTKICLLLNLWWYAINQANKWR